ncbi:uncharacterized protein LOC119999978 isoform X2 [Tripterygium wilfordii]|uniref:uncharacterized protein LOC119999978 isoform X2 n=1 Tax=Tripterygium wilfordii TaxID=458696 RepID=UPI0018F832BC|nr:uncharacterized protein LOC119999978 isoform X2 [Tripterygium wilfordii]
MFGAESELDLVEYLCLRSDIFHSGNPSGQYHCSTTLILGFIFSMRISRQVIYFTTIALLGLSRSGTIFSTGHSCHLIDPHSSLRACRILDSVYSRKEIGNGFQLSLNGMHCIAITGHLKPPNLIRL